MSKSMEQIKEELSAPFLDADVEWRIQHTTQDKSRGLAVPYLQSRAIQSRLDDVVGPYNWKSEYKPWHPVSSSNKTTASQLCGLAIFCSERNEWVQKWDGAENTDIEPVKGGISDSFKRAAVLWGIGRYLYSIGGAWVALEMKGKTPVISASGMQQLNNHYNQKLKLPASNVTPLPVQQSAPTSNPGFDYSVYSAEPRQFATGTGMALVLTSWDGKNNVEAFVQRADNKLYPGTCLKNVKLTAQKNGQYSFNTMDAYEVA